MSAMTVVTTRFSGRTFNTQEMRAVSPRIALVGPARCAAEAVFAEAKAFLSSCEARQMSVSDLERELHQRRQELVRKLLQEHRDQRSRREAAGPVEGVSAGTVEDAGTVEGASAGAVEGASGVECPERREHSGGSTNATPKRPPAQRRFRGRTARRAVTTVCIRSMPR